MEPYFDNYARQQPIPAAFASFPDERVTGRKLCEKRSDEWVMNVWWFDLNSQASTHLMFWGFDSPCHGASALDWFYGNSP
eukprot:g9144.t1